MLYYKNHLVIPTDFSLLQKLIYETYDTLIIGHGGYLKTLKCLSSTFFFGHTWRLMWSNGFRITWLVNKTSIKHWYELVFYNHHLFPIESRKIFHLISSLDFPKLVDLIQYLLWWAVSINILTLFLYLIRWLQKWSP